MSRCAVLILLLACGSADVEMEQEPEPTNRYAIRKTLLSSTCATPPTIRDQVVQVDRETPGVIKLDDGNGTWNGTIDGDGNFVTDPRRGNLADGALLEVTLTGQVTPLHFSAQLDAVRGEPSACRYAISWIGDMVPAD